MGVRIVAGAFSAVVALIALAMGHEAVEQDAAPVAVLTRVSAPSSAAAADGLLYGRVTTEDGATYEGRLRFGGDEEALWSNYFNGFRRGNPWLAWAPAEMQPKEGLSIQVFQFDIEVARRSDVRRPFMARFGDIARLDAEGRDLRATLRSGTVVELDRYAADDYADGVRVWDAVHGVVDLHERDVRSIEFLPTAPTVAASAPLYGTVRTRQGEFSGLIQWDREASLFADELTGNTDDGALSVPFAGIRSIARRSPESARVTLRDGRTIVLSGTRAVGEGNRGLYVDDARYGRVLISWDAFEEVEFSRGGSAPGYDEFTPGGPLTGTVVTRTGRQLTGRLIYDLDESETIETLDAPWQGIDYTIPFERIASISPAGAAAATVTLHGGEQLRLEAAGDLADGNPGMLVFSEGADQPEYVRWTDIARIDFDAPPAN